jgi:hypothetical protein
LHRLKKAPDSYGTNKVKKSGSKASPEGKVLLALATLLLALSLDSSGWVGHPVQAATQAQSEKDWSQTVRDVLTHEIDAQIHDTSLWCYRKLTEKNGKELLFSTCQSRDLELQRLIAVNGKPLSEQERKVEDERIGDLLNNSGRLKKEEREQQEDAKQARNLLELIPNAFLFQKEAEEGDLLRLHFTPNPKFHPLGHEGNVFHHMEGTLTLNVKQKRLAEMNGRLTSEVKFGGGLLGHLDKGGTFMVKEQEMGPGCWEMIMLDVKMDGKALFFKTIGVRQREVDTRFQRLPPSTTVQQAADMTRERDAKVEAQKQ